MEDGCPVCVARAEGRPFTVLAMRAWALSMGSQGRILKMMEGAPADAIIDAPSATASVYITTSREYATWYAARSRGDLYRVAPVGELERSPEDNFETYRVTSAEVLEVVRRGVYLDRSDRRRLERLWRKADAKGRLALLAGKT
jgi:hypothetical protein